MEVVTAVDTNLSLRANSAPSIHAFTVGNFDRVLRTAEITYTIEDADAADTLTLLFEVRTNSTGTYTPIKASEISGVTTNNVTNASNAYTATWVLGASMNASETYDVRLTITDGYVSTTTNKTGITFADLVSSGTDLDEPKVFNSPYQGGAEGVAFYNLIPNTEVRIYTISGTLVAILPGDGNGMARWSAEAGYLVNDDGNAVAPGVYIAYFIGEDGVTKTVKKIAVLR